MSDHSRERTHSEDGDAGQEGMHEKNHIGNHKVGRRKENAEEMKQGEGEEAKANGSKRGVIEGDVDSRCNSEERKERRRM